MVGRLNMLTQIGNVDELKTLFPPQPIQNSRTLFECDFYDTHRRYFEQVDDDYLQALNVSEEDLILVYGFDWPNKYVELAIEALQHHKRPNESIKTWEDVDEEYLYYFSNACSFLEPSGFKFFMPAAMFHYANSAYKNNEVMVHFLMRFNQRRAEDSGLFNEKQLAYLHALN